MQAIPCIIDATPPPGDASGNIAKARVYAIRRAKAQDVADRNERARVAVLRHLECPSFLAHLAHLVEDGANGPVVLDGCVTADGEYRVGKASLSVADMAQTIDTWISADWSSAYHEDYDAEMGQ